MFTFIAFCINKNTNQKENYKVIAANKSEAEEKAIKLCKFWNTRFIEVSQEI